MSFAGRRKQKWAVDPRNTAWSNDDSKFGQRMLEKMGWSKGKVFWRRAKEIRTMQRDYKLGECIFLRRQKKLCFGSISDFGEITKR